MLGYIDTKEKKALKDLLRMDQVRGSHSVGVFAKGVNQSRLFKKALSPDEMFTMKGWEELERGASNLYIGHNRHATQGAINSVNAHPFEQGIIVGAHNGTLRQQSLLPDHKEFTVDSENIMHSLSKVGVKATVESLNGAYALTWYNKEDNTFNFVRNNERELYYCYSEDYKTLFWASERWMLYGALGRNGIGMTKPEKVEVDKHYSIIVPMEYVRQAKVLEKLTVRSVVPYKAPPVKTYTHTTNNRSVKGKQGNIYGFDIGFTKGDKLRVGDTVYFWQGDIDKDKGYMSCPVESKHKYDARVHMSNVRKDLEKMLTDDLHADTLYEGVICGQFSGVGVPAVIINPNTVRAVSAKKQEELLLVLMA